MFSAFVNEFCLLLTGEGLCSCWDLHLAGWSHHWAAAMDLKERRHRTLTHGRCGKDFQFTTSTLDHDERRVPTQKSYSSSETLKAFDHESRLHYGGCVTDLVHHEVDEFTRQGGKNTKIITNLRIEILLALKMSLHSSTVYFHIHMLLRAVSDQML